MSKEFDVPLIKGTICRTCFGTGAAVDYEALGLALANLRVAANITQADLARKLGLSGSHISDLEHGTRKMKYDVLVLYLQAVATD